MLCKLRVRANQGPWTHFRWQTDGRTAGRTEAQMLMLYGWISNGLRPIRRNILSVIGRRVAANQYIGAWQPASPPEPPAYAGRLLSAGHRAGASPSSAASMLSLLSLIRLSLIRHSRNPTLYCGTDWFLSYLNILACFWLIRHFIIRQIFWEPRGSD